MKQILVELTVIIASAFLFMGGCATTSNYATPANAQTATALLGSGILGAIHDPTERQDIAKDFYAATVSIRTLEGGDHVPSAEELRNTVLTFLPQAGKYADLAQLISTAWQAALPSIGGKLDKAIVWAEAIANGLDIAARPYLPPEIKGTPIVGPPPKQSPPTQQTAVPDFSPQSSVSDH